MRTDGEPSKANPPSGAIRMVQEAVQAERARMATLLHDTTCQDLTGGYLMICATAIQCRRLAPELEQKLNAAAEKLQEAGEGLRKLVLSLQPEEQRGEK